MGKNLSSIYLQCKKKKKKPKYINVISFTQVAINKVIPLPKMFKKTDYRSQLINILCFSPVYHSHLAKTVEIQNFG